MGMGKVEIKSLFGEFPGNLVVKTPYFPMLLRSLVQSVWELDPANRMTQPQKIEREFAFDALSLRCPLGGCAESPWRAGLLVDFSGEEGGWG